jgi:hypothetical protein
VAVGERQPGGGGAAALGARKRSDSARSPKPPNSTRSPPAVVSFYVLSPLRDHGPAIASSSVSQSSFGVVRRKPKTEPKKPKPNLSVFDFSVSRSVADSRKIKIFLHRKTEPNCRLKPNAKA